MKFCFSLILSFLLINIEAQNNDDVSIGAGTTILTVVTKDSILMVADSRHQIHHASGRIIIDTVTKINNYKDIFFGIGGCRDIFSKNRKIFDAAEILANLLKGNESFEFIETKLRDTLESELNRLIGSGYISPDMLIKYSIEGKFIGLSLVRFIKGNPAYLIGSFWVTKKFPVGISLEFKKLNPVVPFLNKIGRMNNINEFLEKNPSYLAELTGIYLTLVQLIKIEIKANPNSVNCPIHAVLIKPTIFNWYKAYNDCK